MGTRARGVVFLTLVAGAMTAFFGCIDLFHSTSFETLCEVDATAPGCADAAKLDARRGTDAGDAKGHPPHDAARDVVRDRGTDAVRDTGVDAPPTDFCAWDPPTAAAHAEHACLWLGACAGTTGGNEYGQCYALAALAYDCTANPNQQVRGTVHAYWDGLWQVQSCDDVARAIFPPSGRPVSCGTSTGCATSTVRGVCVDGGVANAENCAARGLICGQFGCVVSNPSDCTSGGALAECADGGPVLHLCRLLADAAAPSDIGKDCTSFGAGACVVIPEAGIGGCAPNDAGDACAPTASATCVDGSAGAIVTGCPTGVAEQINCKSLGSPSPSLDCNGAAATSRPDLASVCYTPTSVPGYCMSGDVVDHAGASGVVQASCSEAGLHACVDAGGSPACGAP